MAKINDGGCVSGKNEETPLGSHSHRETEVRKGNRRVVAGKVRHGQYLGTAEGPVVFF